MSDEASLRDLLRDARGRRVQITTTKGSQAGLLVGVDLPGEREPIEATVVTSLYLPETREVVPLALRDITRVDAGTTNGRRATWPTSSRRA